MNRLSKYRKLRYKGLFESETSKERLHEIGNPLEVLSTLIDFEMFRPTLEASLFSGERKSNAGRPPIDCVLMFKILFLQRYYGLSDRQIEYQIVDRTSFRKFLCIECVDDVPDEKTVWKYRETLTKSGVYDKLFKEFREFMDSKGFEQLLDESDKGKDLYLDAGYAGQEDIVEKHGMNPIICEKGTRNHPLTEEQQLNNRKKSKTRCLVEHVFGFEEQSMRGLVVRTIGMVRAKANVALTSLVYNVCRYTQIIRLQPTLIG